MHQIYEMVKRVSGTPTNVLVTGESGTGKEMVAKAIHYNGHLRINLLLLSIVGQSLSLLWNQKCLGIKRVHLQGLFLTKQDFLRSLMEGTLFLDEIGELPLTIQVKLLRAIQERVIRRVGGTEDSHVNVRLIAATNRDLEAMVSEETFRQDLYYRLNVIQIKTPPLRDRKDDVQLLVTHFLKKYNDRLGKSVNSISADALEVLKKYDYPGNVRELENIIERTVALEAGASILPESLPPFIKTTGGSRQMVSSEGIEITDEGIDLDKVIGQIEKELIIKAIHVSNRCKEKSGKVVGNYISFDAISR